MGYRSEVILAVAFRDAAQADEVMAVYAMKPLTQKYDLTKLWARHQVQGATLLVYAHGGAKWSEELYEDVKGLRDMLILVQEFADNRTDVGLIPDDGDKPEVICTFPFAWRELEIGEDIRDTSDDCHGNDFDLQDVLWDTFAIDRMMVNKLSE